jgi:hypothetical protein
LYHGVAFLYRGDVRVGCDIGRVDVGLFQQWGVFCNLFIILFINKYLPYIKISIYFVLKKLIYWIYYSYLIMVYNSQNKKETQLSISLESIFKSVSFKSYYLILANSWID